VAKGVTESAVELNGFRVTPQRLAAVGVVDWRGHADVVRAGAFAQHRKPDGRFEGSVVLMEQIPNLRLLDFVVPGGPHLDFVLVAPKEAVGDDAVLGGQPAGEHIGLHWPGDAGKTRYEVGPITGRHKPRKIGHRGKVFGPQAGNR